jgi:hypothetical protein
MHEQRYRGRKAGAATRPSRYDIEEASYYDDWSYDSYEEEEESPSPDWLDRMEIAFLISCVYGCVSYWALITGHPAVLT